MSVSRILVRRQAARRDHDVRDLRQDEILQRRRVGQGHVVRRQYLGEKTSYRVLLPGGTQLDVDCHGPGHDAHAPGATVVLQLNPTTTLVLAR